MSKYEIYRNGTPIEGINCQSDNDAFVKFITRKHDLEMNYSGVFQLFCVMKNERIEITCPGIDLEDGYFSGCNQSAGDCQTCGK